MPKITYHNPNQLPENELPTIFGCIRHFFDNDVLGAAIAQDGTVLATHISSSESWVETDLGMNEPNRKKAAYDSHYPDGYCVEYVMYRDIPTHADLQDALTLSLAESN